MEKKKYCNEWFCLNLKIVSDKLGFQGFHGMILFLYGIVIKKLYEQDGLTVSRMNSRLED